LKLEGKENIVGKKLIKNWIYKEKPEVILLLQSIAYLAIQNGS
jgi:hypothetical protein